MTKENSLRAPPGNLTCLLIIMLLNTYIQIFLDFFTFKHFMAASCLFSEIKSKIIKFATKFQVKQAKFFPSKCTNLLLDTKSVQLHWL